MSKRIKTALLLDVKLALAEGGTGASTQAGAANAVLPSQTGNNGKVLGTDGSNVSWVTGGGGGVSIAVVAARAVVGI